MSEETQTTCPHCGADLTQAGFHVRQENPMCFHVHLDEQGDLEYLEMVDSFDPADNQDPPFRCGDCDEILDLTEAQVKAILEQAEGE